MCWSIELIIMWDEFIAIIRFAIVIIVAANSWAFKYD